MTCVKVKSSSESHSPEIKYIQGGASDGGDGSSSSPWNSLSQAEGGSWNILKVIPSPDAIYGGINLRDGQKIEGSDRDACLFANPNFDDHNGDVFVAVGDNVISGVQVMTAARCGISALDSRNLCVENCIFRDCNSSLKWFVFDYSPFNFVDTFIFYWSTISYFGGPNIADITVMQPCNTVGERFVMKNTIIVAPANGLNIAIGDSVPLDHISPRYKLHYEISDSQLYGQIYEFDKMFGINFFVNNGGILSGSVKRTLVQGFYNGIGYSGQYDGVYRPNRGKVTYLKNKISKCQISDCHTFGVVFWGQAYSLGNKALLIVKNNTFTNNGSGTSGGPPASIEFGGASVQIETTEQGGGHIDIVIHGNTITDETGLAPAITHYYYSLQDHSFNVDVQHNTIIGTTTGIDILSSSQLKAPLATPQGNWYISNNHIKNNDSALIVTAKRPAHGLTVKVEENCFEDIGARNQGPYPYGSSAYDNASYYGAAVILGGIHNPALGVLGYNSPVYDAMVDLGGGKLKSKGLNNFINITGAHFWVEPTESLKAKGNYFDGSNPVDAGVGGSIDASHMLSSPSKACEVNTDDKTSSTSSSSSSHSRKNTRNVRKVVNADVVKSKKPMGMGSGSLAPSSK